MIVASREPGLAWIVIATEDGDIERRHAGNPVAELGCWASPPLDLFFLAGAIDDGT